jgi:hypothetical protein
MENLKDEGGKDALDAAVKDHVPIPEAPTIVQPKSGDVSKIPKKEVDEKLKTPNKSPQSHLLGSRLSLCVSISIVYGLIPLLQSGSCLNML